LIAVVYGCETRSVTLRVRVFENIVLSRIIVPKRGETQIERGWRKLHNEKLHKFVLIAKKNLNDQVKEDEMGRASSTYGRE
jgi:hypothetical protein